MGEPQEGREGRDIDSEESIVSIELTQEEWDILTGDLDDPRVKEIMSSKEIEFDAGKEGDRGHYVDITVNGKNYQMVTDRHDFGTKINKPGIAA